MKINIFLISFLSFFFPLQICAKETVEFDYHASPWLMTKSGQDHAFIAPISIVLSQDKVRFVSGDSSIGGEVCGSAGWHCVRIPFAFNFSINREWKTMPDDWEYDSFQYRNLGLQKISIFGKAVDVYLICSTGGDEASKSPTRDACFNYSSKYGVMAIYLYDDGFAGDTVTAYYAAGRDGLFSSRSRVEIYK